MPNKPFKILLNVILISNIFFTAGFASVNKTPQTLYRVYIGGKSLGLIKSKSSLEKYIDKRQEKIKKKYNVSKVYVPDNLDIEKEITYSNNILSNEKIYNKIKDESPFTIDGYTIKIKKVSSNNEKKKKDEYITLYVLDEKVFTKSVDKTVRSFVTPDEYNAYKNNTQKKIKDTGKYIENIYIQNDITVKKSHIPSNAKIYTNKKDISKYLLFGTTDKQKKYTVQEGDTISDVAFANKISDEEFLIANPSFTSADSLLYPGQTVTLGIIKPQFNVVEEDHTVIKEEKNYETETRYDNEKEVGTTETLQAGVKGENKVTQKIQKINGETVNIVTVNTEVLKEPVKEIIVKGGKQSSYSRGRGGVTSGYGNAIATKGEWGWPATCSSVSSPFGYRWGVLHDGTDIAGCGYGSNIFAAQSGTVVKVASKFDNGNYIIIQHPNGFYSLYCHLSGFNVKTGDYVEKGQVIGFMGQTGYATGVHLHFAIWYGYPYYGGHAYNAMSFY